MNSKPESDPTPISTRSLEGQLNQENLRIIDIRPVEAYNGWRLQHEPRGGHIRGARSIPYKWSNYIDWPEILQAKEILPGHSLVIYGYDPDKVSRVARQFNRIGYHGVFTYHDFVKEWSSRPGLPMSRLPRYHHLVYPRWLKDLLDNNRAPEYDGSKFIVCHAHYQNREAYDEGHIPGAIQLDTNLLESSRTWNRRSPAELEKTLLDLGIDTDTTVILYGRFSFPDYNDPFPGSSAGHLGAMRCAAIMMYAGVKDVRILNGGLQSWIDEGFIRTLQETSPNPVKEFVIQIPAHPEYMVDLPEAKRILEDNDRNLVSVRSWREYTGEVSGYHYIKKRGRIPGSVFGNCGSDAYHMENYRNLDHTTREYNEIQDMWAEVGITPDKHNAFYCGTGWRGSEAFFNAWLMGWKRVSVYDGGWFEWSSEQGNPCATGTPG